MMVTTTHSSAEPNEGNQYWQQKRIQNFKLEDKDDLLIENFEIGFDDDLEGILGAGFISMVTIPPIELGDAKETETQDDDCVDVFPR